MKSFEQEALEESAWREALKRHQELLEPTLQQHLARKSQGLKHPVIDFLFEYYPFRPSHLARWSPGSGIFLHGARASDEAIRINEFKYDERGGTIPHQSFPENRRKGLQWVLELLRSIGGKAPRIGCRGLHEWAMIYNEHDIRHGQLPLRLPHADVRSIVEQGPIQCTHYDAFRFFSESAKPFNMFQPLHGNRKEMEQPGCLHVNMDLYKWAAKFHPWVSSELIREAFFLAIETREIDMRASPYDLEELGYAPILIETVEGQQEYAKLQMDIYRKAIPIRNQLIENFSEILQPE